jgi:P27 family predicted phage terminase small subunit
MNAPQHLDDRARTKWGELRPTLDTTQPGTLDALAAYCVAYSRWTAAEEQVNALGAVVKSAAGFAVPNPYVSIAAAASRQLRQWANVLGLHKRPGRKAKQADEAGDQGGLLRLLGTPTKSQGRRTA